MKNMTKYFRLLLSYEVSLGELAEREKGEGDLREKYEDSVSYSR